MQFHIVDFLIGFFLMNAMPHLLHGLYRIRFLSLFGFSWQANLVYFAFNFIMAMALYHFRYGIETLFQNGLMLGAMFILIAYEITGRFFFKRFNSGLASVKSG